MKPRNYLLAAVLLVILSFALAQAASRHNGARPPVGPPPGVPIHAHHHSINAINVHLPSVGLVPGSKPAIQIATPAPPHHLIGDPPLPSSLADLLLYSSSPGATMRPGYKPPTMSVAPTAPHHLIGDPPSQPYYNGTYWVLGTQLYNYQTFTYTTNQNGLQSGEVNIYTLPPLPGNSWGLIINFNQLTGIVRQIYYNLYTSQWNVAYYQYGPSQITLTISVVPQSTASNGLTWHGENLEKFVRTAYDKAIANPNPFGPGFGQFIQPRVSSTARSGFDRVRRRNSNCCSGCNPA